MALGPTQRVFSAAKRLLKSLVANSETRLRLAVLELEEERAFTGFAVTCGCQSTAPAIRRCHAYGAGGGSLLGYLSINGN